MSSFFEKMYKQHRANHRNVDLETNVPTGAQQIMFQVMILQDNSMQNRIGSHV